MKNIVLGFLLALVCVFTIATTVPNSIMTIKPAQPVKTACFVGIDPYSVKERILNYSAKGYITASVATSDYGTIVVMEKY